MRMTVIAGWLAVDQRSASSAYLISDSRFSWRTSRTNVAYDNGRKLFAFRNSPDIVAYCGDVLFPITTLSQILELADHGLLFPTKAPSEQRSRIILQQIENQFENYPNEYSQPINIYHISRDIDNSFKAFQFVLLCGYDPIFRQISIDKKHSHLIFCDGTGKDEFSDLFNCYERGLNQRTSRNIYQCFCRLLLNSVNPTFGGAPQLVGLYRSKGNGINFGIIHEDTRYYLGSPLQFLEDYNFTMWYNDNFEICDGNTMLRFANAMRQPNPT